MKIKIEIDIQELIEDCYEEINEGRFDLKDAVLGDLKRGVINEINTKLNKTVKENISLEVGKRVDILAQDIIRDQMELCLIAMDKSNSIPDFISLNNKTTSFEEIFKKYLDERHYLIGVEKLIKEVASSFSEELKERYDISFATMVVKNLAENGLLKDDLKNLIN